MNNSVSRWFAMGAVALAAAVSSAPAAAQAAFTASGTGSTCDPQKTGATTSTTANAFGGATCSTSGVTVSLEAWGYMAATVPGSAATGFQKGNLGDFNGGGIGGYTGTLESSNPNQHHAFDNMSAGCGTSGDAVNHTGGTTLGGGSAAVAVAAGCGGAIEGLLMNFSSKVTLSQIKAGFSGADGDFSLYAWTGASTGPNMTNQTLANNASTGLAGWTLITSGDFEFGTNPHNITVGSASLYSSSFLITTYFGAAGSGRDYGNDTFKISGWTANVCTGTGNSVTGGQGGNGGTCGPTGRVPEPGSLALVAVALLGGAALRRKSRRA